MSEREPGIPASRTATVVVNVPGGGMVSRVRDALGDDEVVVGLDDDRARDAEIMLVLSREREALERSAVPGVRWLHAFSTGVDGFPLDVIDGRQFTCSRGANAVPIAEFVLASMLAFVKRFPDTWLSGEPERWGFASLDVLAGKTVGLVGVGAIGTEVARRALAFDMRSRRVPAPVGRARAVRDRVVRHARGTARAVRPCRDRGPRDPRDLPPHRRRRAHQDQARRPHREHRPGHPRRPGRADRRARRRPGGVRLARHPRSRAAPRGSPAVRAPVRPRRARTCRGARPTRSAPRSASSPRTCAATAPARNCTASSTSKPAISEPASIRHV